MWNETRGGNDCTSVGLFICLLKHYWSQFIPDIVMSVWGTVKAVGAAKAKHVHLQTVFWLVCEEGGEIKYHVHRIPGTIWYDLKFPTCNDSQVLSSRFTISFVLLCPSFFQGKLLHFLKRPKTLDKSPGQCWRLSPISWGALPVTGALFLSSDSVSSSLPTATVLDTLWCAVVCWACQCRSNPLYV